MSAFITPSRDDFRAWLVSMHNAGYPVGNSNGSQTCPLARFILQATGWQSVSVGIDNFIPLHEAGAVGSRRELPAWAHEFVRKVDSRPIAGEVSAAEALAILDAVPA